MTLKTSNHQRAPQCAAFVRKMREVFGEDQVTVLYVEENGFKLGEKQPEGAPCYVRLEDETKLAVGG